jgi:hypothetical protein
MGGRRTWGLAAGAGALAFLLGLTWSAASAGGGGEEGPGSTVPILSEAERDTGAAGEAEEEAPAEAPPGRTPQTAPADPAPDPEAVEEPVEPVEASTTTTSTTEAPAEPTTTTTTTSTPETEAAGTKPGQGVPPWDRGTGTVGGPGALGAGR